MGNYYSDTDIKKLFICESMIDCILLWQAGYYAVALNGLGNNRQFKQLNELPISHFILATDNDEAGQSARVRIKKNVTRFFTEIKFPKGIKDIGECTREQIENILVWEVF
jgi:DNA primase